MGTKSVSQLEEEREARIERLKSADKAPRPELKVGSGVCQCAVCGLFFTGVAPFERHLVEGSRCMSPAQMSSVGMATNIHGVWQYGRPKKEMEGA